MARQLRINYPGAFYHVTSRGNEQKAVFKSKRDREKFLEYLETATLRYNAVVHVYRVCLKDFCKNQRNRQGDSGDKGVYRRSFHGVNL